MSEYKRLDLCSLNYAAKPLTYEEAVAGRKPFACTDEDFVNGGILKVRKAEKDENKKCVKLEI